MKSYNKKPEPKKLVYRDFKNLSNQHFQTEPVKELSEYNIDGSQFELFQTISLGRLNKLTPIKQKVVRNIQSYFIIKEVRKTIMTRLRLHNKFLKTKAQEFKQAYSKQRNFVVTVPKVKKDFYYNLHEKNITNNKQFWKTVKLFFSNKVCGNEKITLIGDKTVWEESKTFELYFDTIVRNVAIKSK